LHSDCSSTRTRA